MFRHEALPNPATDIRLLKINAEGNTTDLQCTLTTFTPSKAPDYVALSYVWGLEEAAGTITLNGQLFTVRPNLRQCLEQLRRHAWDHYY